MWIVDEYTGSDNSKEHGQESKAYKTRLGFLSLSPVFFKNGALGSLGQRF